MVAYTHAHDGTLMIKGAYILDLWCDSGNVHPYIVKGGIYGFPQRFQAPSRGAATMAAQRAGWTLQPKQLCPVCTGHIKNGCERCHNPLDNHTTGIAIIERNEEQQTVCSECAMLRKREGWIIVLDYNE